MYQGFWLSTYVSKKKILVQLLYGNGTHYKLCYENESIKKKEISQESLLDLY